jgi:methylamine dehydrogenase heavy chain
VARRRRLRGVALASALLAAAPAGAEVAVDPVGRVEALRAPLSPHVVWASDPLMRRMTLADLESGDTLGVIDGGYAITTALFARSRPELYVPETHYARGARGERTDVVTLYDALALRPLAEVEIPPRRAINTLPTANAALTDDDRFALVANMTPATSVSVVDLERRAFAGEIATPGCALVYAAGARRFFSLCADGALLLVTLDENGREAAKQRTAPFFDPQRDPLTEKAVRHGGAWLFASFEGRLHAVDVSGAEPRFPEPWDLVAPAERAEQWRIGGRQHLAVHVASGRLYSLVHQGPPDTHKHAGSEIWVHDVATRTRVARFAVHSPGVTYLGTPLEFGQDWIWPFHRLYGALLDLLPLGPDGIVVTQDERPLLVTGAEFSGSLAVHDAGSGALLRRVAPGNATTAALQVPWENVEATR